ncbi:MAG: FRG domain-containing protein [Candidatus Lokiarchaeota archaeon]|nr:FRG domain-containing protein [Candidatus Lokiarchaeota archaeon]
MNEIRVKDWCNLQDELFSNFWNEKIGRYRAPYAYRGLSDASYKLETSLIRLGGKYVKLEPHLLKNFKRYSGDISIRLANVWRCLIIARHHMLPTRVLDWTYSPFVAMHFATVNIDNYDKDGVIWIVDFLKIQKFLPEKLRNALKMTDSWVFDIDLLTQTLSGELIALKKLEKLSDENFTLFIEPPSIDDRIINQFALFSIMSDPTAAMDDFLRKQKEEDLWKKIIIPADLKGEIRDKLDQSNITERILFPGLDGISKWLARHYNPRKSKPPL